MRKPKKKTQPIADSLTCWNFANWPEHVFPHDPQAGRHLCREHRDDLLRAGAIVRIGREIIVMGLPYYKWLQKHASRVLDFELPCNKPEHKSKRNNGPQTQAGEGLQ
jgi:hypothetical protein